MKKKLIIISIIVGVLAILFTPIPTGTYKDGGTTVYSALTYKIVNWNRFVNGEYYTNTSVYFFPDNFKSYDELWKLENVEEKQHSFKATVIEINGNSVMVEPLEGEVELKSSDRITFNTDDLEKLDLTLGSIVEITYNGEIMESYPAQIRANSWKIIEQSQNPCFVATVLEVYDNSVLVMPIKGENIVGIDKIAFSTNNLPKLDIEVGSKIMVTFDGKVMYSYPAQINALTWRLL